MPLPFLLRGMIIGLAIAAPVGPIGALCIRRTLADGRLAGFVSGLGAATADAVYGSVAAFGLTAVSSALIASQTPLRLFGGLFLCGLGLHTLRARVATEAAPARGRGLLGAYASTFALTLANPLTILSFAAIFAGLGAASAGSLASAATLVAGVFLGSALWWFVLSGAAALLRGRLGPEALRWVNRLSGLIILGFGAAALLTLFGSTV